MNRSSRTAQIAVRGANGTPSSTFALKSEPIRPETVAMRQRKPEADAEPLDPIAVSLAVWLGLMVSVLGLQRLSEQAAFQGPTEDGTSQLPMAVAGWSG